MNVISSLAAIALLVSCGGDDPQVHDAGLDAIKRLAITVDGPGSMKVDTRSVKVSITANSTTRMDTFPVAGLPSTVDVPAPVELGNWAIRIDGLDISGIVIGRGMTTVPAGTADAMVTLAPP